MVLLDWCWCLAINSTLIICNSFIYSVCVFECGMLGTPIHISLPLSVPLSLPLSQLLSLAHSLISIQLCLWRPLLIYKYAINLFFFSWWTYSRWMFAIDFYECGFGIICPSENWIFSEHHLLRHTRFKIIIKWKEKSF